mgnify:CR=1 FL=1
MPLTLLVGLIVTSSLMGAVYVAINSNQRTRFDFLRFLGRTGLDSLKTQYKALLNDTSEGNIYHYFWVSDGCSERTPRGECPTGVVPGQIQNPSTSYWPDGVWKQSAGRQKGPMCKPNTNERLNWTSPLLAIQETFYKKGIRLNPGVDPESTGFVHSYTTNEIITKARSKQQLISLIGGNKGGVNKAGRSAMINYEIARTMNQAGFAFISAGYNGIETEPIALSNLAVTSNNRGRVPTGSILLRKNVFNSSECGNQILNFRTTLRQSPISGNSQYGGLTIFPAKFPTPDLGNKVSGNITKKGTLMLRKGDNNNAALSRIGPGGNYEFEDLFLLPGSILNVNTSQPVTIKVKGDIHIGAGAKLCNVSGFGQRCGSGSAGNLTIIQGSTTEATRQVNEKLMCDINSRPNFTHTGEAKPKPNSSDGRTFIVQGTGRETESLNAFIYAPSSTFVSAGIAKSTRNQGRYQRTQEHLTNQNYAVVNKGGYLKVAHRRNATEAKIYNLLDERGNQISAIQAKKNGHYYTGVGETRNLPSNAIRYPVYIPRNTILRHNLSSGNITTHGLTLSGNTARVQSERPIQYRNQTTTQVCRRVPYRCWKNNTYRCRRYYPYSCWRYGRYRCRRRRYYWGWYSYWYWSWCYGYNRGTCYRYGWTNCNRYYWSTCYRNQCSSQTRWSIVDLVRTNFNESQLSSNTTNLNRYYNVSLMQMSNNANIANAPRTFKGAVWARNICFSREDANRQARQDWIKGGQTGGSHRWEFSGDFINKIVDRYGEEYNFGLPEYRALNETLVDPQRILSK